MLYIIFGHQTTVLDPNGEIVEAFDDYRSDGANFLKDKCGTNLVVQFGLVENTNKVRKILHDLFLGQKVNWFAFEPIYMLQKDPEDEFRDYAGEFEFDFCDEYEFISTLNFNVQFYVPNKGMENFCKDTYYLDPYLWFETSRLSKEQTSYTTKIENSFFCPNYKDKIHRRVLASYLYSKYPDTSKVSYYFNDNDFTNKELDIKDNKNLINNLPLALAYDNGNLLHHDMENLYRESFCTIITETFFESNFANFSEKTLDPILYGRPFILAAPPYTLKLLHDLGFKTFSKWWDESYDTELDNEKRLQKLKNTIDNIAKLNYNKVLEEMYETLIYNQNNIATLEGKFDDLYRK